MGVILLTNTMMVRAAILAVLHFILTACGEVGTIMTPVLQIHKQILIGFHTGGHLSTGKGGGTRRFVAVRRRQ